MKVVPADIPGNKYWLVVLSATVAAPLPGHQEDRSHSFEQDIRLAFCLLRKKSVIQVEDALGQSTAKPPVLDEEQARGWLRERGWEIGLPAAGRILVKRGRSKSLLDSSVEEQLLFGPSLAIVLNFAGFLNGKRRFLYVAEGSPYDFGAYRLVW